MGYNVGDVVELRLINDDGILDYFKGKVVNKTFSEEITMGEHNTKKITMSGWFVKITKIAWKSGTPPHTHNPSHYFRTFYKDNNNKSYIPDYLIDENKWYVNVV